MDSAKPIYKYLEKQNSQLVDLVTYGQNLDRLTQAIKPYINQHIGDGWQLGKFSPQVLTLIVNSAELASRLRYKKTILLQEIRKLEFCDLLNTIEIKVSPGNISESNKQTVEGKINCLPHSSLGRKSLLDLANSIDDQALKASLQSLAKHLTPTS